MILVYARCTSAQVVIDIGTSITVSLRQRSMEHEDALTPHCSLEPLPANPLDAQPALSRHVRLHDDAPGRVLEVGGIQIRVDVELIRSRV